uniref:Pyridine nucleotide-disulphide oxidoreductase dimerisation domain-containing protein n=1 Tax=Chromera velia CCMP2878 TaxID=1169474 RepID=A0A0G4FT23_9ALVE|eukprot:Cvel_3714.t1-p1 / transcript=Cvel_3714.t1 / gene=Cvel_3714 / organism=Chromera_velia_CCMP2878 / gene_product=Dihydrolipoyl dehydrogenase, putative / transcript_product=Dihydrolipoyl dehydrogenase, putative / location=Cvel_scaffold154:92345-99430(-) / protein_length=600 / sequence_SO=supercontig / SO=protein_coding / is_pseudo=false
MRLGCALRFSSVVEKAVNHFDLCVLGAGQAGVSAAVRAWDFGKRVCVVNSGPVGGATVATGALSSKVLWQLSRQSRQHQRISTRYDGGSSCGSQNLIFDEVQKAVAQAVEFKQNHMRHALESLEDRYRYSGKEAGGGGSLVALSEAKASFIDPLTVRAVRSSPSPEGEAAGEGVPGWGSGLKTAPDGHVYIRASNFLVATGSRPRSLPSFPADGRFVLTSDHIGSLTELPKSMLILGAGVIGCEFATMFANFGQTKVHLVNERRARLLPHEDEDLSFYVQGIMEGAGVTVHNGVEVKGAQVLESENCVEVILGQVGVSPGQGEEFRVRTEKVLLSVGRVPNTDGLGLIEAETGVELDKAGGIKTDAGTLKAKNAHHVLAAGDVTVDMGLVSVADMEGRHAVEEAFGTKNPSTPLTYDSVSSIMFLRPEVSCVGMNETEARRRGIAHKVAKLRLDVVNRVGIDWTLSHLEPHVDPDLCGYIKMIVTDDDKKRLLGMRAIGVDSSAVIQAASLLIAGGHSVRDLESLLHPHPAVTEGVLECARLLSGRSFYKPHVFDACTVSHYSSKGERRFERVAVADEEEHPLVPSYLGEEGGGTTRSLS